MTDITTQMALALATIDRELGIPEDGCNSTEQTLSAIRNIKAEVASLEGELQVEEEVGYQNRVLLSWAYRKLLPYSFAKQEDALKMDEIKLLIEHGLLP